MSDLENKTQEETPKKRPYNLREKKKESCLPVFDQTPNWQMNCTTES